MLPTRKINPFGDDDDDFDFAGPAAWGAPPPSTTQGVNSTESGDVGSGFGLGLGSSDILKDTIKKEAVIKDILAAQDDLRALLSRIKTVEGEVEKLKSGNITLQQYIDTVTKQIARR